MQNKNSTITMSNTTIISVEWLYEHLNDSKVLIFDASMSKVTANTQEENTLQIKGARFLCLKTEFSDTSSEFPNAFPSKEQFEKAARQLGVNSDSIIIVYDDKGIYSSARAWWLFRTFGHKQVFVLDGGLPEWCKKRYPVEKKTIQLEKLPLGNFKAEYQSNKVIFFDAFNALIGREKTVILDARSSDRYNALVAEPRKNLRRGHVTSAKNVPYTELLNNGMLKPKQELEQVLETLLRHDCSNIVYCGSGITACVIVLASVLLGYDVVVYDGSWTEYGTLVLE